MSKSATTSADELTDDDRELFERIRDRYQGVDDEVVRISDLVLQSSREETN